MHNLLGRAFAADGRIDEAIEHYTRALELEPGFADAHNNLGVLLARSGRLSEAATRFEEALRLRPDYPEARQNVARAVRDCEAALQADPDNVVLQTTLQRLRGLGAPAAVAATAFSDVEVVDMGRRFTASFYAEELAALYTLFSPDLVSRMSVEQLADTRRLVRENLGDEVEVLGEAVADQGRLRLYRRRARFSNHDAPVIIMFAVTPSGSIAAISVRPG